MQAVEQTRYHELTPAYFWLAGKRQLILDVVRPRLGATAPGPAARVVLDVGCGPGHDLQDLQALGAVIGLDASVTALQLCRQQHPACLVVSGDAMRVPLRDCSVDVVVLLDVLEHLEDDGAGLRECRRVLKEQGWLVLSVPAFRWLWGAHDEQYGHKRRYTRAEIVARMVEAGFDVERATYIQWVFTLPLWLMRTVKRLLPGAASRQDDFVRVPGWLNTALTRLIRLEGVWISRWDLPWGVSLLCLARPRPAAN